MATLPRPYPLFSRIGIEIEYMIVDWTTLRVLPVADRLLHAASGSFGNEVVRGEVGWSNELAAHCLEIKATEPAASLDGIDAAFGRSIREANALLAGQGA